MENNEMQIILDSGFASDATVFVTEKPRPCRVCGRLTRITDYCFEAPLCSPECTDKWVDLCFGGYYDKLN